jgi:2-methylcitrate dehydratase
MWVIIPGRGAMKLIPVIKYFPAEYHAQSAVWAALQARKAIGSPDDVVSVEVETHEAGYTILAKDREKWAPTTKETADHSLPYMVGFALLKGRLDNSSYSAKNLRDPRILSFLRRISVKEDRGLTESYPAHIANRVTLRLKNGGTVSEQVDDPKGHPRNPMTREEVEEKFGRLTKRFLGEPGDRGLAHLVWSLEGEHSLGRLVELCAVR